VYCEIWEENEWIASGMMETPPKMNEQSTGSSMLYGLQLMMMLNTNANSQTGTYAYTL